MKKPGRPRLPEAERIARQKAYSRAKYLKIRASRPWLDPEVKARRNRQARERRAAMGGSRADHLARVAAAKLPAEELARRKRLAVKEYHRRTRGSVPMAEYLADRAAKAAARRQRIDAEREARRQEKAASRAAAVEQRRERQRAQGKAWRAANHERNRELINRWKRANPEKVRERKRHSRSRGRKLDHLFEVQGAKCAYCRAKLTRKTCHIDHIIPISAGGSSRRSNLQLTCPACNLAKGAQHPVTFAQSTGRLL